MYSAAEAAYGRRLAMRCSDASNLYRMPPAPRSDLLAPLDGRSAPIGRRDVGLAAGSGARSACLLNASLVDLSLLTARRRSSMACS